jgi:endonuclease-8
VPEGPSLYILKEQTARFVGKTIVRAEGNTWAIDTTRLVGQPILALRTWGKQFFIQMPTMVVRIHMLLFGTYRIDEERDKPPRLSLHFDDGSFLNFYACSVKEVDCDIDTAIDWEADVMSEEWNPAKARKKLRAAPDMLACDALLDQTIFSGVGNIIKNEVLFRIRLHPLSTMGALPPAKLRALVEQARDYSFDFLAWKKAFTLKQHWLAHARRPARAATFPSIKASSAPRTGAVSGANAARNATAELRSATAELNTA